MDLGILLHTTDKETPGAGRRLRFWLIEEVLIRRVLRKCVNTQVCSEPTSCPLKRVQRTANIGIPVSCAGVGAGSGSLR